MKARTDPRFKLSREELTRLNEYAREYARLDEECTTLAFATMLHGLYGIGGKRFARLMTASFAYLTDIRRQQKADDAARASDMDCLKDAIRRLKDNYKKQTGNEWSDGERNT